MIDEVTISYHYGTSKTIRRNGYATLTEMRPSGGFEMRPIPHVFKIDEAVFAQVWKIFDNTDFAELKNHDVKNYHVNLTARGAEGVVSVLITEEILKGDDFKEVVRAFDLVSIQKGR